MIQKPAHVRAYLCLCAVLSASVLSVKIAVQPHNLPVRAAGGECMVRIKRKRVLVNVPC